MTSTKKITVALVFGGRSAEHEVSLQSAQNILNALDRTKFKPMLLGIDREGRWFLNQESLHLLNADNPDLIALNTSQKQVALLANGPSQQVVDLESQKPLGAVDVIFPILHGPYGEDGAIQGLARLANLPCVGADVLASAVGMDKDIMKRLLRDANIPVAPFVTLHHWQQQDLPAISASLGWPLFVKPANMGSSVGVSRATDADSLKVAVAEAFQYDQKVIVEQAIVGREVEVSVLGNEDIRASVAGEILPQTEFYSYESKYIDAEGARLAIPAELSQDELAQLQQVAKNTFRVLNCQGMARVDMFLTVEGDVVVNEINTLPGFTNISMYPKLWQESGLSQQDLVTELIDLAIARFEQLQTLKTTR